MIFSWRLNTTGAPLTVVMNVDGPNDPGPIVVRGVKDMRVELTNRLERSYGAFGHSIDISAATPIDIDAALHGLPYDVSIEAGEDMLAVYESPLPEGAVT